MRTPPADIASDAELVARLVEAQHPDLAGPLTQVGNGWDNAVYRLGDEYCVRLPRRRVAVELVLNEQRWLPRLARRLNVPVPEPVRVGEPSDGYPWPWTITRWHAGRTAADVPPVGRDDLAPGLAEFMARLHVPAPSDAPRNPVRGVPLADRGPAVAERLASGLLPHSDELHGLWERLVAAPPWTGPTLWLHGDPHPANLLLRYDPENGRAGLAAVLDFGDLTGGDPATDLAAAWMVFGPAGRAAFRDRLDRLAAVDRQTWDRARGWALNIGSAIAVHSHDNPEMAAIGRHALEQVLLEP
ncbi:aminoglycoside phosphotransferase family protein [Micromonospora sp. NPDC049559]|uniref:aminoglycoside phosphotransferase family protein n=1 Tax=Micromonospora sp. NPDC049559 TaxID=3155923 RepID=UPI003421BFD3